MNWRNACWSTAGIAAVWLMLALMPADAQITPNFRGPPMMPMMSPIGPRDPGFHTQPGNLSNIPMGGATDMSTSSSGKSGKTSGKSTKRVVSKGSSPPSKITTQTVTAGTGRSGAPPAGETRLLSDEVVAEMLGNPTARAVDALVRRYQLTLLDRSTLALTNSTILRLRISGGRSVTSVVRALEAYRINVQPNYRYGFAEQAPGAATLPPASSAAPDVSASKGAGGDPAQYALAKLRLPEALGLAKGDKVPIAIIDSGVDASHPDLAGAITAQFDALATGEPPHPHGTAVAGIVAAHGRLLGAAPAASILAVRAFGAGANGADGTTFNILKGLDWAAGQGARIINLSFTGPPDPLLGRALAALNRKGTILIAAVGNAGPKSPPLYPAADPNVIAVSATDADDKLFAQANRGSYVAVAAPGADILVLAPAAAYEVSSGTSFAAAYITGIAALMLERKPALDGGAVKKALQSTAKDLGPKGRDDQFGAGLVDAYQAVLAVDPSADASARATRQ